MAYRIYRGKGKQTPVNLALLLEAFPASSWSTRTVVLAGAGFGSNDFIRGCNELGFTRLLVGVRYDRKLKGDRKLVRLAAWRESARPA